MPKFKKIIDRFAYSVKTDDQGPLVGPGTKVWKYWSDAAEHCTKNGIVIDEFSVVHLFLPGPWEDSVKGTDEEEILLKEAKVSSRLASQ